MTGSLRWRCFPDADTVAAQARLRIQDAAQQAIAARGRFVIVLAGGTTPEQVYRGLKDFDTDWSRWFVWFGDERCLPVDHPERNSVMAQQAWLAHVPIPAEQVFPMPAELGPQRAADSYEKLITTERPFDLVLLGIGEDGHTASLFPGHAVPDDRLVIPVFDAPKPPPERVSLTFRALCDTYAICVLVTGAAKRDAVRRWKQGADIPVSRLACPAGVDVLLDEAACQGAG
ncbi:6-phosphogluconolactonase [Thiogranum longum]|uniref:6-phosphogluconolactonase n=1 Tax=Thiogranum longum TaxID=1537524 RepID=A0A4R1HFM9_9GAMM|nr:6-phosphogluconolactonase [Thiogranum longum]TCK19165.1 6-phosphogluconolactonase [Thiogranum longum]